MQFRLATHPLILTLVAAVFTGAIDWQLGSPGLITPASVVHIGVAVLAALALLRLVRGHTGQSGVGRAAILFIVAAASGIAALLYVHRAMTAFHAWTGLMTLALAGLAVLPRMANSVPTVQEDYAWPPLEGVASLLIVMEVLQATLGVLFRHGIFPNIIPHALGSILIGVITMYCIFTIFQQPHDWIIQRAAKWTVGTLALQVMSGVGAFAVRMTDLNPDLFDPGQAAYFVAVLHVTSGSLFLTSTVVLATLILRAARLEASPHPQVHYPIQGS